MSHLLILNYSMDENSSALGHQIEVVKKFSLHFNRVTVVTGFKGVGILPSNVDVLSSNWILDHNFRNIFNFLRIALPLVIKSRPDVVFSHMTHIQSSLILPLTRFMRIPHYLWYAHASSSLALKWDYLLVRKILTSTKGSFPHGGRKVIYIGQAVDEEIFFEPIRKELPVKFIHYGRFDASKRIDLIINSTIFARKMNQEISLTICGNPSNPLERKHANEIISNNRKYIEEGWLTFVEAIPRKEISVWIKHFDVLVHAFQGSLDKVLIESVIAGLTVVTVNEGFISEFGSWGKYSENERITLENELYAMMSLDGETRNECNLSRQNVALLNHTEARWIEKVCKILKSTL